MSKIDELKEVLNDIEFGDSERETIASLLDAAEEEQDETLTELDETKEYSAAAEREYNELVSDLVETRERAEELAGRLEEALASEEETREVLDNVIERVDQIEEARGAFPDSLRISGIRMGESDEDDRLLNEEEREMLNDGNKIRDGFRLAVDRYRDTYGDIEPTVDTGARMPEHVAMLQATRTASDLPRFEPSTGSNVAAKL